MRPKTPFPPVLALGWLCAVPAALADRSPDWSAPRPVSDSPGPSVGTIYQGLAIDGAGGLHLVWSEQSSGFEVFYARSTDGGVGWSPGRRVVDSPGVSAPNLAVGPDGGLHLAWVDRREGTPAIYYARSQDGGTSFEQIGRISAGGDPDVGPPAVGVDLGGQIHVAYHVGDPDLASPKATCWYVRSLDGGDAWSAPLRLDTSSGHAAFPRFDVTGTDGSTIAIAWRDQRRAPDWDVYVAVSTDGGTTFVERPGAAGDAVEWDPTAAVDAFGHIHLAYMTFRPPSAGGGITVDYRRADGFAAAFGDEQTLSEGFSRFPFWAPDPARGRLWLFWKDERDVGNTAVCPGPEHCADLAGRYSDDGGTGWSPLELATDLGATEAKFPSPAVGPDGRPHVAWSDTSGGLERVYAASRLDAPGGDVDPEPATCATAGTVLCLGDRWAVEADWETADDAGAATPHPLVADTGAFWFFRPENLELVVKVLDGCGVNGHAWVFAAGLTNVAVTLRVTDTASGAAWSRTTPAGAAFAPIQDTVAFACD